jgi:ribosomal protein L34
VNQPAIAPSSPAPPPEISSRECRLLERLADHVHFVTRWRHHRPVVRRPHTTTPGIALVRLRRLERAGLLQIERVHGRLAVVPTPAGERLVAERREKRRARRAGAAEPVVWWL